MDQARVTTWALSPEREQRAAEDDTVAHNLAKVFLQPQMYFSKPLPLPLPFSSVTLPPPRNVCLSMLEDVYKAFVSSPLGPPQKAVELENEYL